MTGAHADLVNLAIAVLLAVLQETPFPHPPPAPLPEMELTLADTVAIAAEYDIKHDSSTAFCRSYYGLTEYDTKTITICSRVDVSYQLLTLLHEMWHVKYFKLGYNTGGPYEAQIEEKAKETYKKIFGK